MKAHIIYWFIFVVVAMLAWWSWKGNSVTKFLENPPLAYNIIYFLLGLNLVIQFGIKIIRRFF